MSKVTGIVYVKVDGALQRSKDGASLSLGGKERTPIVAQGRVHYVERIVPSECEFTLAHVAGDDLIGLHDKIDPTLEFLTDTGDTYVVRDAFSTTPPKITGGEGDVPFVFNGAPAELV